MITLNFKYHYSMEYRLKSHSFLILDGIGKWEVDEIDLAEEFCVSEYDFADFLNNYFCINLLEIDYDSIEFDIKDIKELQDFCEQYKSNI